MCLALPGAGNKQPPLSPWQWIALALAFIGMVTRMLLAGLAQKFWQ